jgi:hypothetical protein
MKIKKYPSRYKEGGANPSIKNTICTTSSLYEGGIYIILREKKRSEMKASEKNIPPLSEKISPVPEKGVLSPEKI